MFKTIVNEALFLKCSFYAMEGNVLNGFIKKLFFEVGFKADLTSKMGMRMKFIHYPKSLENKQTNGMEIGIFGVRSKTFVNEALFPKWSFFGMQGNVLNGLVKKHILLIKTKLL